MSKRTISAQYDEAVESFIELARSLTDAEWSTPVPCTPAWTARDVLSHVTGIPDDAFAGRMDGPATDPWTASQVERNASFSVDELIQRWESQRVQFATIIEQMGEYRPPYDCHSHEHDVRQAIGRPGNRDSAIIDDASSAILAGLSDVPVAITVNYDDGGSVAAGQPGSAAQVVLDTSKFEVFRSRLGRRSIDQVRALAWTGDPDAIDTIVAAWFNFGPSEVPIIE